jgi:hypothetical protein
MVRGPVRTILRVDTRHTQRRADREEAAARHLQMNVEAG